MSRKLTIKDAINEALRQEMDTDPRIVLFGEDIAGGAGRDDVYPDAADAWGGPFGVTKGLLPRFGRKRVIDTALAETGFIGASIGAAIAGLRPVAEIMYIDFIGTSFDQLLNHAAKLRYVYGGKISVPLVVRTVAGAGFRAAAEHSQTLYSLYTHVPGLKVVAPATAYDAKGLLISAIRDPDPVVFIEHKRLYLYEDDVPEEPYTVPLGSARVHRNGDDITIVGVQKMVHTALDAAEALATRRHRVRGHRPALLLTARHGGDPHLGTQDRATDHRRRIPSTMLARNRHRRPRRRGSLRLAESTDSQDHGRPRPGSVQPATRGRLPPQRRKRRRGRPRPGHEVARALTSRENQPHKRSRS